MTRERQEFVEAQQQMLRRYAVEAESRFVDVASIGGKAHVLVMGEGPEVVMCNGIGTPAAMWAPLMAKLGGFRLFAVDLPAYGLTDGTERFTENLRANAVRFLEEVLDALGLMRPRFVANSLGSLWTSWLALDRPARVAALVHIGYIATVLDSSPPLWMRLLAVRSLGRLLTRLQPPSPRQVKQLSRNVKEHPLVPELADLLLATERLPGFREMFLSTLHVMIRLRGFRPGTRLSAEQLARIDRPALLFWGKNDPFGGAELASRVAAIMPNAELRVVGGGHAPWLTQSEQIGPIATRFLRQAE